MSNTTLWCILLRKNDDFQQTLFLTEVFFDLCLEIIKQNILYKNHYKMNYWSRISMFSVRPYPIVTVVRRNKFGRSCLAKQRGTDSFEFFRSRCRLIICGRTKSPPVYYRRQSINDSHPFWKISLWDNGNTRNWNAQAGTMHLHRHGNHTR